MLTNTLTRTTVRLSPNSMNLLRKKSLQTKSSIQKLIEDAILHTYSNTKKTDVKTSGVHSLSLGKMGKIDREHIYSYLDEKF
jgi:hypothetical protein